MPALILILLALASTELEAQSPIHQNNWAPDRFVVVCDKEDQCWLNQEQTDKAAELMSEAAHGMKKMPFDPPRDWGYRIGKGTESDYIELYQREGKLIAAAAPQCGNNGRPFSSMLVGESAFEPYMAGKDYLLHYFMAHEVFHLIQYGYPFYDPQLCAEAIPGWVAEGLATAVGLEVTRQRYPSRFPSTLDDREARQFAGLRRYDRPLPHRALIEKGKNKGKENWSGDKQQYFTSSFWRHIAQVYHRGKYNYVHRYMRRAGKKDDWVPWLSNNIEDDLETELGMVFSGFVADYAGWGRPGYPGAFYGRSEWLKEAFGGCERVYLDREKASDWIDLEILPLSAKCVEVHVLALGERGLKEGDSAAVQIAGVVMDGPEGARDGLHLSIASSNAKMKFHCAKEAKAGRFTGIGKCMMYPDDGELRLVGAPVDARMWNVHAQEPGGEPVVALEGGGPADERGEAADGKGDLVNLYTVSYTPLDVSAEDTKYGGRNPVKVRIYFVLDVARLELGGPKKGAVGSFGKGDDPQTTVPKKDSSGRQANSFSLPEQLRPTPPALPAMVPAQVLGKLGSFNVSVSAANGEAVQAGVWVYPVKPNQRGEMEHYPLSVGESGTFQLGLIGNLGGEPLVAVGPGSLIVEEFTDLVFRARYNATLCRLYGVNLENDCPNPIPVSGEIVKAFAGARLPGNSMLIERTEGTEMYRKANEKGLAALYSGFIEEGDSESGESTSGPSTSDGGSLSFCACSCEEREASILRGEEFTARSDAGEDIPAGAIMGLMRCQSQCQSQYMICALDENKARDEREAAEQKARNQELKGECDCSCEGMQDMQGRLESMLLEMQQGSPTALQEMQQMGQCMSVCQGKLMECAGK